mmetsp:Transcript_122214/g.390930  ORF Transcript_122214/g.390930 Transcript_122214/m.390930 type:complete len:654 (+) Transcript_122214:121-2082(+)|eukprot:CAMPEP_0203920758 /NCGR_PEP_ID=MMETSP0359-20131031/61014_1 /ASSEMBLY_ACC=CAM_ASM_000338 /TAXON_ID=268821 /ORGANISM="Scrippsiella Hangoei, Strain SHTV-5" /LENGTH=653 /DNA_ID=CAMNT_0050848321 /DNA_START=90 /DNA_END=2051 /DNA_ORIENTATION=+
MSLRAMQAASVAGTWGFGGPSAALPVPAPPPLFALAPTPAPALFAGGVQVLHQTLSSHLAGAGSHFAGAGSHLAGVASQGVGAVTELRVETAEAHPSKWILDVFTDAISMVIHVVLNMVQDPMQATMEILVISILAVFIWFACYHWDKVCYLLTGDQNLHIDSLDFANNTLQCLFGTGEWSRYCCCGKNIFLSLRRLAGVQSHLIKVGKITVGDLPCVGRHNYYVTVEVKSDPPLSTSVAQHKLPKIIQFPETVFIRLRRSLWEHRVRVSVRRRLPVGHEEVCEVWFSATSIMDLCDHKEEYGVMRFEMKSLEGLACETPPWLAIRFSYAENELERNVDDVNDDLLHTYCCCCDPRLIYVDAEEVEVSGLETNSMIDGEKGTWATVGEFKKSHPLCDTELHERDGIEPDDQHVKRLYWCRAFMSLYLQYVVKFGFWGFLIFSILRTYWRTCYQDYKNIAIAEMGGVETWGNLTWPLLPEMSSQIMKTCEKLVGDCADILVEGLTNADVKFCCPSRDDILGKCAAPPEGFRPFFMRRFVKEMFNTDIGRGGLECSARSCDMATQFWVKHDMMPFILLLLLLCSAVVVRCMWDYVVRSAERCFFLKSNRLAPKAARRKADDFVGSTGAWGSTYSAVPENFEETQPLQNCVGCTVM